MRCVFEKKCSVTNANEGDERLLDRKNRDLRIGYPMWSEPEHAGQAHPENVWISPQTISDIALP